MKNKLAFLWILGISVFSISSCQEKLTSSNSQSSSEIETKQVSMYVRVDYGLHVENQATLLLDYSLFFFNPTEYGIDYFVAGDYVTIDYTGEFRVLETYPGQVETDDLQLQNVAVERGDLYEFEVIAGDNGENTLKVLNDAVAGEYLTEYVINEDGSFAKYSTYEVGTKIYGINPKYNENKILAFYKYRPFA